MPRVAIVDGCRTPFVKVGGAFGSKSTLDLSLHVINALSHRESLDDGRVDELIFSSVLLDPRFPNLSRELVLRTDLPDEIPAHFISNNCISGLVAANMIREGILSGRIESGIAGGVESMSRPALSFSPQGEAFFYKLFRARSFGQKLSVLSGFRPSFVAPQPPSPKEPSTGKTMGQHCEMMAKDFSIPREEQDRLALKSHKNSVAAKERGFFARDIVALDGVSEDNLMRADTSLEKLSTLKPVFDRSESGTLTAGNSSPLTDGASAVVLMSEEKAKAGGKEILGYIDEVVFSAVDPKDGLLMAPALAVPQLMHSRGLSVDDIDRFEIHEAFAAQVLANMKVWAEGWEKYPQLKPIGRIPEEKINVNGGSIAIGHPFAATGGRLLLSTAHELKQSGGKKGLISVCAAGAMAAAVLISVE